MKKLLLLLLLLMPASVLAGTPTEADLDGEWQLLELNGVPLKSKLHQGYIEFDTKKHEIRASGGCNLLGGNYTFFSGRRPLFTDLSMTEMACEFKPGEQDPMEMDAQLNKALYDAEEFAVSGDNLTLHHKRKILAKFKRKK